MVKIIPKKIKDIIGYNLILDLIRPLNQYDIVDFEIFNKDFKLVILDTKNKEKLYIVLTFNKFDKSLFNINKEIYLYYSFDCLNNYGYDFILKLILKIVKRELSRGNNYKILKNFIEKKSIKIEETEAINNLNEIAIKRLRRILNIYILKKAWPEISDFQILKHGQNKRVAILVDIKGKRYFLKIYAENYKLIDNLIRLNRYLVDKINTPKILDYKKIFNDERSFKFHFLLFEYIKAEKEKANDYCIDICNTIKNLHQLKLNSDDYLFFDVFKDFSILKNQTYNPLRSNENFNRRIYMLLDYFNNIKLKKGICHGDLHFDQFIRYKKKWFIIDFDSARYSYPLFDIAMFINKLLRGEDYSCIKQIIKNFSLLNKELLLNSLDLVSFHRYYRRQSDLNGLIKELNSNKQCSSY